MNDPLIDQQTWGNLARMLWQQMAFKPKNSPDWTLANVLLHAMASEQFDVYAYRPEQDTNRPA